MYQDPEGVLQHPKNPSAPADLRFSPGSWKTTEWQEQLLVSQRLCFATNMAATPSTSIHWQSINHSMLTMFSLVPTMSSSFGGSSKIHGGFMLSRTQANHVYSKQSFKNSTTPKKYAQSLAQSRITQKPSVWNGTRHVSHHYIQQQMLWRREFLFQTFFGWFAPATVSMKILQSGTSKSWIRMTENIQKIWHRWRCELPSRTQKHTQLLFSEDVKSCLFKFMVQWCIWRRVCRCCLPPHGCSHFSSYVQDNGISNLRDCPYSVGTLWCSSTLQVTTPRQRYLPGAIIWMYTWIDSTIVLNWLTRNHVGNRVSEIVDKIRWLQSCWLCCPPIVAGGLVPFHWLWTHRSGPSGKRELCLVSCTEPLICSILATWEQSTCAPFLHSFWWYSLCRKQRVQFNAGLSSNASNHPSQ